MDSLLIGIDYIGSKCELSGKSDNASKFAEHLKKRYLKNESNLVVMCDTLSKKKIENVIKEEVKKIDEESQEEKTETIEKIEETEENFMDTSRQDYPSSENIRNMMSKLLKSFNENKDSERVYFLYYSGHTENIVDINGDYNQIKHPCFFGANMKGVFMNDMIADFFTKLTGPGKIICIVDGNQSELLNFKYLLNMNSTENVFFPPYTFVPDLNMPHINIRCLTLKGANEITENFVSSTQTISHRSICKIMVDLKNKDPSCTITTSCKIDPRSINL